MELSEEKAMLKRALEGERALFVVVAAFADDWLKLVSSLPSHYGTDVRSFLEQTQTVQVQCSDLVHRIDTLQLEQEIDACCDERNKVAEYVNDWRGKVIQALRRFDSVLAGPLGGNA